MQEPRCIGCIVDEYDATFAWLASVFHARRAACRSPSFPTSVLALRGKDSDQSSILGCSIESLTRTLDLDRLWLKDTCMV